MNIISLIKTEIGLLSDQNKPMKGQRFKCYVSKSVSQAISSEFLRQSLGYNTPGIDSTLNDDKIVVSGFTFPSDSTVTFVITDAPGYTIKKLENS